MDPSVDFDIPIFKTLPKIIKQDNYKIDDDKTPLNYIDITKIQDAEPFRNSNKNGYLITILFILILFMFFFRYFCFFFFFKKD